MVLEIIRAGCADPEFAACMAIRFTVFVGEQNVPAAEERDAYDATARHFLALLDGIPAGTARVLEKPDGIKITRVAVLRDFRGRGLGEALLRHVEATLPARPLMLDAQLHARAFYERLGYAAEGEVFLEAGIAHVRMRKQF